MSQGNFLFYFNNFLFPPFSTVSLFHSPMLFPLNGKKNYSSLSHAEKFSYFPLLTPSLPGPWVLPVDLKWLLKSSARQSAPCSQRCWLVKGAHLCYSWILVYYHQGTRDPLRTEMMRKTSSIVSGMVMRT